MIMRQILLITLLVFLSMTIWSQNDNLIENGDFENGDYNYDKDEDYNFENNISDWECRMRELHTGERWHSPEWIYYYLNPDPISGDGLAKFSDYELIQQKLDDNLIENKTYKLTINFNNREHEAGPSSLKIFISKKKIKYKNEFVPIGFNPDNYVCNDNYRQYKNQLGQEIKNIKTINLLNYPTQEWITETFLFEVTEDGFNWITFDLHNNINWEEEGYPHCCLTEYIWLDKLELTKHPYCNWEEDPCSPTDGPIHTSYPDQVDNHSNVMVTGLDNVRSATNIKIRTIHGQVIEELEDRYCINGIDTIVWDGLNLAPAYYIWQMTLENDCGEQNYWRAFPYHNDELPIQDIIQICNNSIQTPIPCCESEPDIYIEDETIEGPGELSFHAINNIEVENTTVEANTEKLIMKAGNKITLKPGTHIKEGAYAHFYIEPCETTSTHESLPPETNYTIPMAEVHDKKLENDTKNTDENATIYPNPCASELHVNILSGYGKQINIEIFDLNGGLLCQKTINCRFSQCSETINTASMNPGMYIIKLTGSAKTKSFKIVKQ
jgi:hypothetical protein